jgi:hypothetical protein|tara:strand:- start:67 stop:258 length:192 start_codon:yes stop_codon:yes gene_type:complete
MEGYNLRLVRARLTVKIQDMHDVEVAESSSDTNVAWAIGMYEGLELALNLLEEAEERQYIKGE